MSILINILAIIAIVVIFIFTEMLAIRCVVRKYLIIEHYCVYYIDTNGEEVEKEYTSAQWSDSTEHQMLLSEGLILSRAEAVNIYGRVIKFEDFR